MKEILQAINSLHKDYVIHRDLKPSNIVLGKNAPINLKIIDFGSAKKDSW